MPIPCGPYWNPLILGMITAFVSACATPETAPTINPEYGSTTPARGLVVMAHGGDPEWNRSVEDAVAPIREVMPVRIAYGMADTATIREAVRGLEKEGVARIAVVRLFISGESFKAETQYILNLRPDLPNPVREENLRLVAAHARDGPHDAHAAHGTHAAMEPATPIVPTARVAMSEEGLMDSDALGPVLADRVMTLSKEPSKESVLILGHGPADDTENSQWLAAMERHAAAVRSIAPFRAVRVETLREDWPEKRALAEERIRQFA